MNRCRSSNHSRVKEFKPPGLTDSNDSESSRTDTYAFLSFPSSSITSVAVRAISAECLTENDTFEIQAGNSGINIGQIAPTATIVFKGVVSMPFFSSQFRDTLHCRAVTCISDSLTAWSSV
jgi:hypothetical protein